MSDENPNSSKERIGMLSAKCNSDLKEAFYERCAETGVSPSAILRKLAQAYVDNKIKFEV